MSSIHAHLIISARKAAGISQAELARRAGMTRSVVNVYERGHREPGSEALARLLTATGHRLAAEPVASPVDPSRAGRILEQVLELAEALPYRAGRENDYPPLAARLA
jgi:transcriptional regulator with XRE-family HTH domain